MFLSRVRLVVAAALTLSIGVGLSAGPATGPAEPPAAVLRPDPKEKPAAPDLAGVWAAEVVSPDGKTRRDMVMRFVDGKHLVWSVTQSAPGVRVTTTARYSYRLADGELTLHILERYNGGEKLPPRKEDRAPRVYTLTWGGKDAFSIRDKADPTAPAIDFRREPGGVEKVLLGGWHGTASCQGDVTFRADGTYSWIHFGPGDATVAGSWAIRWDALPPTLVMTPTASTDKDYIVLKAEVKVLRLDDKSLVYEQNGHKVEFTREPEGEPKKERDVELIRGRWTVVKDEYSIGEKWVEAEVPADFGLMVTAESATVTRRKTSLGVALTLHPATKEISLVRAQGGIDKLERGVYRLNEDSLTICVIGGGLLPADAASKAATLRLYHLIRVVEPKK
jgi:hypothetical protein